MGLIAALTLITYLKLAAPDGAPSARFDPPLVYDANNDSLLLFGGSDGANRNDLWRYSIGEKKWTELQPAGTLPPPRFGHSTVFDPVRRRLIVFGGQAGGFFYDVWAYDIALNQWTELAKDAPGPSARYGHSAIYDRKRDRMVISHGFTTEGRFDDTWAFSFSTGRWTELTPSGVKPLKRCLHHAAYDGENDQFLLFGGCSSGYGKCPQDDLWSFDLGKQVWTQLPGGPPARERYAMAFDSQRGRLIVFGGSGFPLRNDTWAYDVRSRAWMSPEEAGDVPSPRSRVEGVYAEGVDAVFWFGGITDSGLSNELFRLDFGSGAKIDSVVNAFSGQAGGVAPGELVSIFGSGLREPVTFGGTPAQVSFVNAGQVNARVPESVTVGQPVTLAAGDAKTSVDALAARPGLFSSVFNGDGTQNTAANPAAVGSVVSLYATGIEAGAVALEIGGVPARVVSASLLPGVVQVNAVVPALAPQVASAAIAGGNSIAIAISAVR